MSAETTKSLKRRKGTWLFNKVFSGHGIDIGAGADCLKKEDFPNIISIKDFDLKDGDAQYIDDYVKEKVDFIHSSQCLEHLGDPFLALSRWLNILKPGGYLIATFPEEDLYEQGVFPSRWNSDHKKTFTIFKNFSWSEKSINVLDMLKYFSNQIKIIKIELIDTNYDYNLKNVDQTRGDAEAFVEIIIQKL